MKAARRRRRADQAAVPVKLEKLAKPAMGSMFQGGKGEDVTAESIQAKRAAKKALRSRRRNAGRAKKILRAVAARERGAAREK